LLNLEKDADEFACIASAAGPDKVRAGKELGIELSEHVIEDLADHPQLGRSLSHSNDCSLM
jgi:hypothetical protein